MKNQSSWMEMWHSGVTRERERERGEEEKREREGGEKKRNEMK